MTKEISRATCLEMDQSDPLAARRDDFVLPENAIYLDGNSLGAMTHAVAANVERTMREEWAQGLIRSWNDANWITKAMKVGDTLAGLIGADDGEVVVCDSTSVNVYKQLAAALDMRPDRNVIVSEAGNFPTDLYMAQGLIAHLDRGHELRLVQPGDSVFDAIDEDVAVVMLTHVDFKSGLIHDMDAVTGAAHDAGALMLWDLCHTAGAMPVDLNAARADLAVGCTYKYLNGGPGAPAFIFVARHLQDEIRQPLTGWMGHNAPFAFDIRFEPAGGIERMLSGSHGILGLSAVEAALDVWQDVDMNDIRAKSIALCELFIELVETRCAGHGFELISPRDAGVRGSQISFIHAHGFEIMQALIGAGVIGDYREPNVLRFGFTPLYVRFVDVWDAVDKLTTIMTDDIWQDPKYAIRGAVT
jgi:kynureninase